jgi:magnesium transporter
MSYFQNELDKATVLSVFLPLVISSGGNSGSQASTLVIRAMALGEFTLKGWWMVLRRELKAGLFLGIILGTIGYLRISVWALAAEYFHWKPIYTVFWPRVAATVGIGLIGIVMWGSIMGAMLPFVLKKCGLDPATSSAPFVATLVDVTGLIIYFCTAMLILRGTLL